MRSKIITNTQADVKTGHESKNKTKEIIITSYWWLRMETEIKVHIKICAKCHRTKKDKRGSTTFVSTLSQCSEPNRRIHFDLIGPLKTMLGGKKFFLCVANAFLKCGELVAIPDKSAPTEGSALFSRWLCRHGLPLEIVSDNGKELCIEIVDTLLKLMKIKKTNTTPFYSQTNVQADVCYKTIAAYLKAQDKCTI